ncbi:DUF916 domain-containing protein [Companilactobacillus metriopterae]|uniref:DUF916 domain-containing protein n=1 Tax=Companilactobacillus metriopterae TaxID=1909267 RepID=UPI00100A467E|nr:DUF916 domain-containing protein [Companilactobacillus metriopterae]
MKRAAVIILSLASFFAIIFIKPTSVQAEIQNITVTPLVGDSDITDRFELIVKPGETREIKVSVSNFENNNVKIKLQPTNATTSEDGKIAFTDMIKKGDFGLKYAFADMTKAKTIELGPQETKDLAFKIKIPNEKFSGVIIGGFNVFNVNKPNQAHSDVPVWLTESNESIGGILKIHSLGLQVIDSQPNIILNLSNTQPGMMKNLIVHGTIKRESWLDKIGLGDKEQETDQKYPQVAPNSRIPLVFNQSQSPIKAGKYHVQAEARSGKATWKFEYEYMISPKQAQEINDKSKDLVYDKTWTYVMLAGVLLVIVVFVFWLLFAN